MKKTAAIICLALSTLVMGCVAAVVAGAAGGLIVYDNRSITMIEKDARIFYQVHKAIVNDPTFHESRIVVTSFNRVVLLTGQTSTVSLKKQAERIAQKMPGVQRVYNQITVQDPIAYSQRTKDTWITGQVRAQMLTKKGLESGSIRVVTENSVVYLMGIATREQANLAVEVARKVDGVTKVVKVFRYIT